MLGSLVEQLQSLVPKRLWLASVLPVTLFFLAQGAFFYRHDVGFRAFADKHLLNDETSLLSIRDGLLAFLLVFLLSFVYLMINTFLRELLEGEHWPPPGWLRSWCTRRQQLRRDHLQSRYGSLQEERRQILNGRVRFSPEAVPETIGGKEQWLAAMKTARKASPGEAPGGAPSSCAYDDASAAAVAIRALERRRAEGRIIFYDDLNAAVAALVPELERCAVDFPPTGQEKASRLLDRDQAGLLRLIDWSVIRLADEVIQLSNQRQFGYPDEIVAPTGMGNIARSVGSYSESRYGLNISLFWTRLQKVLQGEDFYSVLQDSKTQLDFGVASLWLVVASTLIWSIYLLLLGHSAITFALVALLGPLLARMLYKLCLQNYRVFADLLRSAVDVYRFDLLAALGIARPADTHQERRLWEVLNQQLEYGERAGLPYTDGSP